MQDQVVNQKVSITYGCTSARTVRPIASTLGIGVLTIPAFTVVSAYYSVIDGETAYEVQVAPGVRIPVSADDIEVRS